MPEGGCVLASLTGEGLRQVRTLGVEGPGQAGWGPGKHICSPWAAAFLSAARAWWPVLGGATRPETETLRLGLWLAVPSAHSLFPCPHFKVGHEGLASRKRVCVFLSLSSNPSERNVSVYLCQHWGQAASVQVAGKE